MEGYSHRYEGIINRETGFIRWQQLDSDEDFSTFELPIKHLNTCSHIKHGKKVFFSINNAKTHAIFIEPLGIEDEFDLIDDFKKYFLNNTL